MQDYVDGTLDREYLATARAVLAEATGEAVEPARDAPSRDVLVTLEGGLVRSVVVDGLSVAADVRDYDVEGCDDSELSR